MTRSSQPERWKSTVHVVEAVTGRRVTDDSQRLNAWADTWRDFMQQGGLLVHEMPDGWRLRDGIDVEHARRVLLVLGETHGWFVDEPAASNE